eukprot:Rhum_TRINITY_DN14887_c4_g1::Rhum_TRINITY_DN14887_c4_g1_i1::g.125844::m.125844
MFVSASHLHRATAPAAFSELRDVRRSSGLADVLDVVDSLQVVLYGPPLLHAVCVHAVLVVRARHRLLVLLAHDHLVLQGVHRRLARVVQPLQHVEVRLPRAQLVRRVRKPAVRAPLALARVHHVAAHLHAVELRVAADHVRVVRAVHRRVRLRRLLHLLLLALVRHHARKLRARRVHLHLLRGHELAAQLVRLLAQLALADVAQVPLLPQLRVVPQLRQLLRLHLRHRQVAQRRHARQRRQARGVLRLLRLRRLHLLLLLLLLEGRHQRRRAAAAAGSGGGAAAATGAQGVARVPCGGGERGGGRRRLLLRRSGGGGGGRGGGGGGHGLRLLLLLLLLRPQRRRRRRRPPFLLVRLPRPQRPARGNLRSLWVVAHVDAKGILLPCHREPACTHGRRSGARRAGSGSRSRPGRAGGCGCGGGHGEGGRVGAPSRVGPGLHRRRPGGRCEHRGVGRAEACRERDGRRGCLRRLHPAGSRAARAAGRRGASAAAARGRGRSGGPRSGGAAGTEHRQGRDAKRPVAVAPAAPGNRVLHVTHTGPALEPADTRRRRDGGRRPPLRAEATLDLGRTRAQVGVRLDKVRVQTADAGPLRLFRQRQFLFLLVCPRLRRLPRRLRRRRVGRRSGGHCGRSRDGGGGQAEGHRQSLARRRRTLARGRRRRARLRLAGAAQPRWRRRVRATPAAAVRACTHLIEAERPAVEPVLDAVDVAREARRRAGRTAAAAAGSRLAVRREPRRSRGDLVVGLEVQLQPAQALLQLVLHHVLQRLVARGQPQLQRVRPSLVRDARAVDEGGTLELLCDGGQRQVHPQLAHLPLVRCEDGEVAAVAVGLVLPPGGEAALEQVERRVLDAGHAGHAEHVPEHLDALYLFDLLQLVVAAHCLAAPEAPRLRERLRLAPRAARGCGRAQRRRVQRRPQPVVQHGGC